jgi:hypothetical protein
MDKAEIKRLLLAECIKMQKAIVANARSAMEEAQESAMEYDETAEDNMVDSYREEMQNKRDMFAKQLENALDDLALLNKVSLDKSHDASFGSVIVTEAQKLFVCISLGQVKIEGGDSWFAISPSAPLYKAIQGKKTGETFNFRDKDFKILDIF